MQDTLPRSAPSLAPQPIARPSLFSRKTVWALLFVGATIWALVQAGLFQEDLVNPGGWPLLMDFFKASLNPDLSPEFLRLTLNATVTTLAFAVCGTALSLVLGFFGGILASEVWWQSLFPNRKRPRFMSAYRLPWGVSRSGLAVFRAIHEVIWGLFFVNVIGLDPLTAILAIAIPFGAITAKVYSEILDELPREAYTALLSSGVSPAKALAYTLIPQASLDWLSYSFYRFECAIRAAAVLGIIGAGGLGQEIFLSFQTLNYAEIWTLFYALFLLNGLADYWSGLLRGRLGSQVSCAGGGCRSAEGISRSPDQRKQRYRSDPVVRMSLILVLILTPFSFWYLQPDWGRLFSPRALQNLIEVIRFAVPPDFRFIPLSEWLEQTQATLAMTILAMAGAGLLALLLSYPAARNFLLPGGLLDTTGRDKRRGLLGVVTLVLTRAVLLVSRSIPAPIWALMFLFVLFPGILPAAAALGVYTLGVLGRLMAEVVENMDDRPLTALKAQGASGSQIFTYGVLPLTFTRYIAYFLYRWEETIRATVVVGLVGAGGLGWLLIEELSSFDYQAVLATLIVFIGLIFVVDIISAAARRDFREP